MIGDSRYEGCAKKRASLSSQGSKTVRNNYRTVSLANQVAKLFVTIVLDSNLHYCVKGLLY